MESKILTIESELKMPGMQLPIKSTVVSVGESIVLISPLPEIKDFKDTIEKFGTPTDIVAPSGFHHLGIKAAAEMYPSARLWGVPVLQSKRKDIVWDKILPQDWPFAGELDIFHLRGMPKIDEMVFYHRSSKSLIVSDLFFNHIHGKGFGYWLMFNMFGTYKKFAVSRFFTMFIKDKSEFRQSMQEILSLDIGRIIVSHGVDVVDQAKQRFEHALRERHLI